MPKAPESSPRTSQAGTSRSTSDRGTAVEATVTAAVDEPGGLDAIVFDYRHRLITPMLERFLAEQPDGARNAVTAYHPLGRLGAPADVAEAFVYLASDEAAWVTGTSLVVDGGLTAASHPVADLSP